MDDHTIGMAAEGKLYRRAGPGTGVREGGTVVACPDGVDVGSLEATISERAPDGARRLEPARIVGAALITVACLRATTNVDTKEQGCKTTPYRGVM